MGDLIQAKQKARMEKIRDDLLIIQSSYLSGDGPPGEIRGCVLSEPVAQHCHLGDLVCLAHVALRAP